MLLWLLGADIPEDASQVDLFPPIAESMEGENNDEEDGGEENGEDTEGDEGDDDEEDEKSQEGVQQA